MDNEGMPRIYDSVEDRFWNKVNKTGDCWLWDGWIDQNGFGSYKPHLNEKKVVVHRQSWLWAFGKIPTGKLVLQRCGHKHCVRPSHLYLGTMRDAIPVETQFWKRVRKTSSCWLWKGWKHPSGYGTMSMGGHIPQKRAHRFSWEIHHGKIPDGQCVLHHCDVRHCVNPKHLFLGSRGDNARDMVSKNRQLAKERNPQAKLTRGKISEIRKHYSSGNATQKSLGAKFGVCRQTIADIVHRKLWSSPYSCRKYDGIRSLYKTSHAVA